MTIQERVKNRKVGIIGMARSGVAAALLVIDQGGTPFVSDIRSESELTDELKILQSNNIDYETGGHTDKLLESDFVILSPGVPSTIEIVQNIKNDGIIEINGNSDFAVRFNALQTAFDQLKSDFNTHTHVSVTSLGTPSVPVPQSTADITPAKVNEVKL